MLMEKMTSMNPATDCCMMRLSFNTCKSRRDFLVFVVFVWTYKMCPVKIFFISVFYSRNFVTTFNADSIDPSIYPSNLSAKPLSSNHYFFYNRLIKNRMKSVNANAYKRLVIVCLFSFLLTQVFAQGASDCSENGLTKRPNVSINSNVNGYLEYLPPSYAGSSSNYPLIIYLNGIGSTGDGSSCTVLHNQFTFGNYPHEQQWNGTWPVSFTVNSQTFEPVFITPQFVTAFTSLSTMPTPQQINDVINYAVANYRIDTTRIYLIGSSQGGGMVWDYLGAGSQYARRIAAAVEFGGVAFPTEDKTNVIRHNRVPVWGLHNSNDELVPSYFTNDFVDLINRAPAPTIPSKKTMTVGTVHPYHVNWNDKLLPSWTENGLNIYQWLLQYQKPATRAHAGYFQVVTLPSNTTQLSGSGTGPNGTVSSINWQKISGPAVGNISNPNTFTPTIHNLEKGKYVYQLNITDNASGVASHQVEILVDPAAQRTEAENWTAMSGVATETTADAGGGLNVAFIDQGDWMEYSVTVPSAGNYKMRFRIASQAWNAEFQIKRGGTVLKTVDVFETGWWQSWLTRTVIVPLNAGTQTIRLEATDAGSWNINWLEVEGAATSGPLPVSFSLFNANCNNGSVELTWKTATETNSGNFSVEKSSDGRAWTVLTTVSAAGQSTSERSYSYIDRSGNSNNFYRIVEEGLDGRKTYSSIVRNNCSDKQTFSVFPNPVDDKAVVTISSAQNTRLSLSVFDSKGAIVRTQQSLIQQGTNQISVNMSGLAQGTYTLMAQWNNESRTIQFLKK